MAHDSVTQQDCQRLYCDELLTAQETCARTGVALATFYRWRTQGSWDQLRELSMSLRDKLGKLLLKLLDTALKEDQVDAQKIHGLVNTLNTYQRSGSVREKIVYIQDAEVLFEAMKKIEKLRPLLEDQVVLTELGALLKNNAI